MHPVLSIDNLSVTFQDNNCNLEVLRKVSLSLQSGSTLALVGESGSGKSMTALAIMGLIPSPGVITSGTIQFDNQNITNLAKCRYREIRGRRIAMIFQDPMTSLNPVLRISDQLCEPLIQHLSLSTKDALDRAVELLSSVGIASPKNRITDYPHQLSGGMRQRVMIAMALACNPELLIADEPTTALDVTIQSQILELLDEKQKSCNLTTLLITHDLGIVAERSEHTAVMYGGQIVEYAETMQLFANPCHPYTKAMIGALPQFAIPGKMLPALNNQPERKALCSKSCGFAARCPEVTDTCRNEAQELIEINEKHLVRCWKCL